MAALINTMLVPPSPSSDTSSPRAPVVPQPPDDKDFATANAPQASPSNDRSRTGPQSLCAAYSSPQSPLATRGLSPGTSKPAAPISTREDAWDCSLHGEDGNERTGTVTPRKFRRDVVRDSLLEAHSSLSHNAPSSMFGQRYYAVGGPGYMGGSIDNASDHPEDDTEEEEESLHHSAISRHSRARGGGAHAFAKQGRPAGKPSNSFHLRQFAEATLGSGSLRKAVKLPEGEDINEWLAVNVVDFYNQINLLYGATTEFCSPQTCPEMKATDEFEYLWQDSENFKKPTKMPAPEYVEHLMAWCQSNIDNEQMFPSRIGVPFPKGFPSLVRQMFKRLYRVYAHIYCHHYPVIIQLGLEPHLNTSFKHYVLFIDEHQLASGKDYWGPLGDLVESMLKSE